MNFISLQQLERDVKAWAQNIPPYDRVACSLRLKAQSLSRFTESPSRTCATAG